MSALLLLSALGYVLAAGEGAAPRASIICCNLLATSQRAKASNFLRDRGGALWPAACELPDDRDEDRVDLLRIVTGEGIGAVLRPAKPCTRCPIPDIDPATARSSPEWARRRSGEAASNSPARRRLLSAGECIARLRPAAFDVDLGEDVADDDANDEANDEAERRSLLQESEAEGYA